MDAIREEAEQCPALVNPFNIDTDNIRRLSPFEFLLPKWIYIWQDSEQGLHRNFVAYSDYQYLWEEDYMLQKRILSILYFDRMKIESKEKVLEQEKEDWLIYKPE